MESISIFLRANSYFRMWWDYVVLIEDCFLDFAISTDLHTFHHDGFIHFGPAPYGDVVGKH
jgi:hypothetical protein